ncbi:MAG: hypothetical protein H6733_00760 [Alphaproteobacteria bacterium]|nr:hypothetical protein [Alphaproteobacteria bacterium]
MEIRLNGTHLLVAGVAIAGAFALVEVADAVKDMVGAFNGTEHRRDREDGGKKGDRADKGDKSDKSDRGDKSDKSDRNDKGGKNEAKAAGEGEHTLKKEARKEWREALSDEELKAHRQQMRDKRIAATGVDPREERRERRNALQGAQVPANLPFLAPDGQLGVEPPAALREPIDTDAQFWETDEP